MILVEVVFNCCYEVMFDDNLFSYEVIENMEQYFIYGILLEVENDVLVSKLQKIRDIFNKVVIDLFFNLFGKVCIIEYLCSIIFF